MSVYATNERQVAFTFDRPQMANRCFARSLRITSYPTSFADERACGARDGRVPLQSPATRTRVRRSLITGKAPSQVGRRDRSAPPAANGDPGSGLGTVKVDEMTGERGGKAGNERQRKRRGGGFFRRPRPDQFGPFRKAVIKILTNGAVAG